jgi:hypothetical protein
MISKQPYFLKPFGVRKWCVVSATKSCLQNEICVSTVFNLLPCPTLFHWALQRTYLFLIVFVETKTWFRNLRTYIILVYIIIPPYFLYTTWIHQSLKILRMIFLRNIFVACEKDNVLLYIGILSPLSNYSHV